MTKNYDAILVDLRKYGFSILTGLITAGSFLGLEEPTQILQVGVIIVNMILIVILYWLDTYYENLIYGAILRSRFLEIFRLERGLSVYVSHIFGKSHLAMTLRALYFGFLGGVFVLGLFAVGISETGALLIPLVLGVLFSSGAMIGIYYQVDKKGDKVVEKINGQFSVCWKIIEDESLNELERDKIIKELEKCIITDALRYL
jgi:hypothetical protein